MLGYMQFLHNDWLKQILSWQHPSGCFGSSTEDYQYNNNRLQPNVPKSREEQNAKLNIAGDVVMPEANGRNLVFVQSNASDRDSQRSKGSSPIIRRLLEERSLPGKYVCMYSNMVFFR